MLSTMNISLLSLNKRDVKIINKKISGHMKRTLTAMQKFSSQNYPQLKNKKIIFLGSSTT